MIIFRLVRE